MAISIESPEVVAIISLEGFGVHQLERFIKVVHAVFDVGFTRKRLTKFMTFRCTKEDFFVFAPVFDKIRITWEYARRTCMRRIEPDGSFFEKK